jgi:hypothetical protein
MKYTATKSATSQIFKTYWESLIKIALQIKLTTKVTNKKVEPRKQHKKQRVF